MKVAGMFSLLRQRNFGLLWTGSLISFIGNWMLATALPYYVYQQTGSTIATAIMTIMNVLPHGLLGSLSGVFVDRWSLKRLLVISNLLQLVTVLLLLLLRSEGLFWLVYLVAVTQAVLNTFQGPAENTLLPRLVEGEDLLSANALNSLNNNLARLIGPPLGGLLLGRAGLESVVICNSISFLVAAVAIALIHLPPQARQSEEPQATRSPAISLAAQWSTFWREWREGMTLIRQDQVILTLMVVVGVMGFGGTILSPLYPAFFQDVMQAGAMGYGLVLTAQALGGILGGLVIGQLGRALPTAAILGWGNILVACLLLLLFNIPLLPLALGLVFVIGPEQVAVGAALQTLFQQRVPERIQGRVFGTIGTTNALFGLIGASVAGLLGATLGIVPTLNIAAGLTLGLGMITLLVLPRKMAEQDQAEGSAGLQQGVGTLV